MCESVHVKAMACFQGYQGLLSAWRDDSVGLLCQKISLAGLYGAVWHSGLGAILTLDLTLSLIQLFTDGQVQCCLHSTKEFVKLLSKWPMKWRHQKPLEVSLMHHPGKPQWHPLVMSISKGNPRGFLSTREQARCMRITHKQEGKEQRFTKCHTDWGGAREMVGPRARKILCEKRKKKKVSSTPPVQMRKHLIECSL